MLMGKSTPWSSSGTVISGLLLTCPGLGKEAIANGQEGIVIAEIKRPWENKIELFRAFFGIDGAFCLGGFSLFA